MTDPKDIKAGLAGQAGKDSLLEAGPAASAELSDTDLANAAGGAKQKLSATTIQQDVTVNKAKTADKAFNAMDAYIRS
jgi:hypothetical protein